MSLSSQPVNLDHETDSGNKLEKLGIPLDRREIVYGDVPFDRAEEINLYYGSSTSKRGGQQRIRTHCRSFWNAYGNRQAPFHGRI